MKFKKFTVPPAGRNKYGNYMSSSNVTQAVVKTTYYGDSSTNNGKPDKNKEPTPEPEPSFLLFLSKTYTKFDGQELSLTDVEDNINLIGYKNLTRCDTYVGVIDGTTANDAARATKVNYDVQGIPEVGMTVIVENNGTPETNIKLVVSKDMTATKGTLKIPCSVYRNSTEGSPLGDDISAWESLVDECTTLWLEYNWDVMTSSSDAYILELTNDNASINCDADGNILSGTYKPTCTAELYYGTEKVADATYGISYLSTQNVVGVSIDTTTGILTFGSNFTFDGTPLEIMVTASIDDNVVGRKVMTISKAMAGKDGADGRQGAAMRGPVNYYKQIYTRRWCNGVLTNASYPEDAQFIDIMIKDNITYVCTTSYNGSANDNWSSVSAYWREVENEYDFVATNLLMAENASIDFTTSNALYLRDSNGDITAGAEGGNGVSFWAGANEPENGKFKVNYDGSMVATKGKFGLLEIGEDDWEASKLKGEYAEDDYGEWDINIQPQMFEMNGYWKGEFRESVRISPYANVDKYDMSGVMDIWLTNDEEDSYIQTAIYTNGAMDAAEYRSSVLKGGMRRKLNAPLSMLPVNIEYMTDNSSKFSYNTSTGVWTFNGGIVLYTNPSGVLGTNYAYTTVVSNNGEWVFKNNNGAYMPSGIWTTTHTKENNVIYIVI